MFTVRQPATGVAGCVLAWLLVAPSAALEQRTASTVPRWGLFEATFASARTYDNPLQDAELSQAPLTSGLHHPARRAFQPGSYCRN